MKKKTKLTAILVIAVLIIILFPIRLQYKDGGTKAYRSILGIYEVTDWNQMGVSAENFETRKEGITVKLFGMTVFDNSKTREVTEYTVE